MTRFLLSLCLLAGLAGQAPAAKVAIRWHGQSFFEIQSGKGTLLAVDPHNIEAYGRREVKPDAVLMSHPHIDHTAAEPIVGFASVKKLHGIKGNALKLRDQEFNEFEETVKDIKIQCVGAYHDKVQGMTRGKTGIFILEVDGLRIVHLGDLGHTLTEGQLKKIGKVDVLMIPVGGIYTLNGAEAKEVVEQLKPRRYIIPMHYGTPVYDYVLDEKEFLEDQPRERIKRLDKNELVIESEEVPRKEMPIIAVLGYEQK
jgi:L-ascorbate metabolism protein UlaG (beta-lactamase superfamily)